MIDCVAGARRGNEPVMSIGSGSADCRAGAAGMEGAAGTAGVIGVAAGAMAGFALGTGSGARLCGWPGIAFGGGTGAVSDGVSGIGRMSGPEGWGDGSLAESRSGNTVGGAVCSTGGWVPTEPLSCPLSWNSIKLNKKVLSVD